MKNKRLIQFTAALAVAATMISQSVLVSLAETMELQPEFCEIETIENGSESGSDESLPEIGSIEPEISEEAAFDHAGSDYSAAVKELTNNQSIVISYGFTVSNAEEINSYIVKDFLGKEMKIGSVSKEGDRDYRLNFTSPLPAGMYTLLTSGLSHDVELSFIMELDLKI